MRLYRHIQYPKSATVNWRAASLPAGSQQRALLGNTCGPQLFGRHNGHKLRVRRAADTLKYPLARSFFVVNLMVQCLDDPTS